MQFKKIEISDGVACYDIASDSSIVINHDFLNNEDINLFSESDKIFSYKVGKVSEALEALYYTYGRVFVKTSGNIKISAK